MDKSDYVFTNKDNIDEDLKELITKMGKLQYDYINFGKDMSIYADKNRFSKSVNDYNKKYTRDMLNMCVKPLRKGVNKDSIFECVGMYIGMSLVSKEFRKGVRNEVTSALYPIAESYGNTRNNIDEFNMKFLSNVNGYFERFTGKKSGFIDNIVNLSDNAIKNRKLNMWEYKNGVLKAENSGYLPLSPDVAAMVQLSFIKQAYDDMRVDGADVNKVMENYNRSSELLYKLAYQRDNISREQLDFNVRVLAGRLSCQYGYTDRYFSELAFGHVGKSAGYDVKFGDGSVHKVWRGEYTTRNNNDCYKGGFTPRVPNSLDENLKFLEETLNSMYSTCHTMEDIKKCNANFKESPLIDYFNYVLSDDLTKFDDKEQVSDLINKSVAKCCDVWLENNPVEKERFENMVNHKKSQQKQRDSSQFEF